MRSTALLVALQLLATPGAWAGDEESQTAPPRAAPSVAPLESPPASPSSPEVPLAPPSGDPADATELALRRLIDQLVELELRAGGAGPVVDRSAVAAARATAQDALVHAARLRQDRDARSSWERWAGPLVGGAPPVAEEPPEPPGPARLDDAGLARLEASVGAAPFNEGKLQALQDGLGDLRLSTAQGGRLLDLFSFSRDRADVLVLLHPRLLDPERFDVLLAGLRFESDREAVRARLRLKR